MRVYLLKGGLQIEVPVIFMVNYSFPNLIKMTHIFPIKKGRGSFEKSQQYHCSSYACEIFTDAIISKLFWFIYLQHVLTYLVLMF